MRGAIIILDGPDAAGKTSLAEAIAGVVGEPAYHYEHLTYIKDDAEMFKANYMEYTKAIYAARAGQVAVIDRGWISENIYSAVYRGGSKLAADVRSLDRLLIRHGALYVMCCPTVDFAVANHAKMHQEREEMYEPDDRIARVAAYFRSLVGTAASVAGRSDPLVAFPVFNEYASHHIGLFHRRPDVVVHDISQTAIDDERARRQWTTTQAGTVVHKAMQLHQASAGVPAVIADEALKCSGNLLQTDTLIYDVIGDSHTPPFTGLDSVSRRMNDLVHAMALNERRVAWTNDLSCALAYMGAKQNATVVLVGKQGVAHEIARALNLQCPSSYAHNIRWADWDADDLTFKAQLQTAIAHVL